jgi:hypothetical protein
MCVAPTADTGGVPAPPPVRYDRAMRRLLTVLAAAAVSIGLSFFVSSHAEAYCVRDPINGSGCLHLCPRSLNCFE